MDSGTSDDIACETLPFCSSYRVICAGSLTTSLATACRRCLANSEPKINSLPHNQSAPTCAGLQHFKNWKVGRRLAQTACSPSKSHGFAASCPRGPLVTTENKQNSKCAGVLSCRLQMMQVYYRSNTRHVVRQASSQVQCASPARVQEACEAQITHIVILSVLSVAEQHL